MKTRVEHIEEVYSYAATLSNLGKNYCVNDIINDDNLDEITESTLKTT